MDIHTDVVIVGCGVAGLYSALKLPRDMQIVMLTKSDAESSDSFLAQGGICVQRDDEDYDSYFEDTMKAGHYENRRESVDIMIRGSRPVIQDLVEYGVRFEQEDGEFVYTREGAHSRPRILFHEDITGKEITGTLLSRVRELPNVTLYEYTAMTDIIVEDGACRGVLAEDVRDIWKDAKEEEFSPKHTLETSITWYDRKEYSIYAKYTILATGGIGGSYQHSTNYPHLTGDAIEIAKVHGIRLENLDYVQIHPTTLYSEKPGRRFLISESVRGEGAVLYNGKKERFVGGNKGRDS